MKEPLEILDIHTHHLQGNPLVIYNNGYHYVPADMDGYYSVGLHPWDADKPFSPDRLLDMASDPRVLAIGETGLDSLRGPSVNDIQLPVFIDHINVARLLDKPLILHIVKQWDMLLRLRRDIPTSLPWIIHGFRGKPELARTLVSKGFYLSIGANFNPDSVRTIPDDRLLIETDTAEVAIQSVLDSLALTRGVSPQQLAKTLNANASRLFNIPPSIC